MSSFFSVLARSAMRFHWWFIGVWAVVLVVAAIGAGTTQNVLQLGGYSLPGTEFNTTSDVLSRDLNISSDRAALAVFHSNTLKVTDVAYRNAVETVRHRLLTDHFVVKAESFYSTGIPDFVSPDNHTTYALVTLKGADKPLEQDVPHLRQIARSNLLQVQVTGNTAANYDTEQATAEDLVRVERFTLPIVVLLLVLVFGSLVAAGIPLALGAACVMVALAVIGVIARMTDVSIFALNTASMVGLGLAIDFSLMLVRRFREEAARASLAEALDATMQTAGRSITFSAVTLTFTMLVLCLFPVMIIRSIALAIAVVAFVALIGGLLLLPSLLVVLSPHLDRADLRRLIPGLGGKPSGSWYRWALRVMRRPGLSIALALGALILMALPAVKMQRIGVTAQVLPASSEARQAVETMQRSFGPGEVDPIFLVVQAPTHGGLWTANVLKGILALHEHLIHDPRVAHVQSLASLIPNPSPAWIQSLSRASIEASWDYKRVAKRLTNVDGTNTTALLIVYSKTGAATLATRNLLLDIRAHARTWAPNFGDTRVLVGGTPAMHYDFDQVVYSQFPILVGLSLLVTFIILMVFFHSLVLPLKAIFLNLVSLVASYGILVIVFQGGHGDSLLGFHSLGAILSYTPVLLFSILFGLSTDYEVFLLSRVREYVRAGESNEEAVAQALEHTAGVITAAGLIMIAVFGSFAFTQVLIVKELGFGLAVAILLDTTLVRLVLVPAMMKAMGDWNWWMPRSLSNLVPDIEDEPTGTAPAAYGMAHS